jgi:hypothetical protein
MKRVYIINKRTRFGDAKGPALMEKKIRVEKKTTAQQVAAQVLTPVLPLSTIEKLPHTVLGVVMSMTRLVDLLELRQASSRVKTDVLMATKATPWTKLDVEDKDFQTWLRLDRMETLKKTLHTDRIDTLTLSTSNEYVSFWFDAAQWFRAFPAMNTLNIYNDAEDRDEDFRLPDSFPWSRLVHLQMVSRNGPFVQLFLDAWLAGKMTHLRAFRFAQASTSDFYGFSDLFRSMKRQRSWAGWSRLQDLGLSTDMRMDDWTILIACCPNLSRLVLLSELGDTREPEKHLWVTDELFAVIGKAKWASTMRHFVWNTQQFRGVTSKSLLALAAWTELRVLKLGGDGNAFMSSDDVLVPEADAIACLSAWSHLTHLKLHPFCIQTTAKVLDQVPQTIERLVWQVPGAIPEHKEEFPGRRVVKPADCKSSVTAVQIVSFLSSHPRLVFFERMLVVWLSQDPHFSSSRLVDVLTTRNRDMEVMHMAFQTNRIELDMKDAARLLRAMRKLQGLSIGVYRLDSDLFDDLDEKETTDRPLHSLHVHARRMRDGDACLRRLAFYFPRVTNLRFTIDQPSESGLTYHGVATFLRSRPSVTTFSYNGTCERTPGDEVDIAYLRDWIASPSIFLSSIVLP